LTPPNCRGRRAAIVAVLMAFAVAASAQPPSVERRTIAAQQVDALGIRVQPADGPNAGSQARYPAQVVVPVSRQRLVAAPLPALVESLQVAVGDEVRAGQVLAVLRSTQASELQRDVAQANSQADLARRNLERDEQLFAEGLIAQSRLEAARAQARQAQAQQLERRRALAQALL
jgi:multidrug efflux pump subunit AcrA (membrane-fusion protein)